MGLETGNTINDLNESWPLGTDPKSQGDDHIRLCKRVFKNDVLSITNGGTVSGDVDFAGAVSAGFIPTLDDHLCNKAYVDSKGGVPVGTVLMYPSVTPPTGFLLCDGSVINAAYTQLIALVGANTPDFRGQFIRGWSTTTAQDPNAPRNPLSAQNHGMQSHSHTGQLVTWSSQSAGGVSRPWSLTGEGDFNYSFTTANQSGGLTETRPKNIAMAFIIKHD